MGNSPDNCLALLVIAATIHSVAHRSLFVSFDLFFSFFFVVEFLFRCFFKAITLNVFKEAATRMQQPASIPGAQKSYGKQLLVSLSGRCKHEINSFCSATRWYSFLCRRLFDSKLFFNVAHLNNCFSVLESLCKCPKPNSLSLRTGLIFGLARLIRNLIKLPFSSFYFFSSKKNNILYVKAFLLIKHCFYQAVIVFGPIPIWNKVENVFVF